MNWKLRLLDGFLIRAYALLFGIAVGTASTLAAPSMPPLLWNRATQALVSTIPLPIRPLYFRCTVLACGPDGNGRGYEASDGARLGSWGCGFRSEDEARSYMQSELSATPTIVEKSIVVDDEGQVSERVIAVNDSVAVAIWRDGAEVTSVTGPTPRHVMQLIEQVQYP